MSRLLERPRAAGPRPAAAAPLAVRVVASAAELEALAPAWEALWERSPRATPFQHPAWLLAWWRHLGGGPLHTLTAERGGSLVALLPLFVWVDGDGRRQLTPVGNGISDHVDLLAAPGIEDAAAAILLAHLARADGWDTAELRDLPDDSPLLAAAAGSGLRARVEDDEPCPTLALPEREDAVAAAVPAAFLKKARYSRRRLGREFAVEVEPARDAEGARALLDHVARLHAARWAGRGEPGVLASAAVRAMHREAASAFAARGMLRMYALRLDGEVAAAWYGFAANGRVHYYIGGFDPAYERYSLGTVLVGEALERAAAEGARELDFLRGREPYKYAWGAADRPQRRLRLERGG